ncbi:polysaccharide deacetylase family protein [Actinomadura flavalba]|uniref:polysaccharide deacetylase family protein n=1 Tax=Actinomadura flavalba TaxID=1120938 RepID=UPI00036511D9|nr:polysaccharide deacetylase family protein [Actinomadura flavalba]
MRGTTGTAWIGAAVLAGTLTATSCGAERTAETRAVQGQAPAAPTPTPSPTPPPPRRIDCAKEKCVALTFDDGPGPYTEGLLDDLRRAGARATFFMLGQNVGEFPQTVRRMALEGHELANHSWSHPMLTNLSTSAVKSQVQRTQDAIRRASGVTPTLFRPPYGATDKRVAKAVALPEILWSVDTLDWRHRNVSRVRKSGVGEPRKGGIVLFHDIHESTVKAVPEVVAGLKRKGFTPVTVSELYGDTPPEAGRSYLERVEPQQTPPPVEYDRETSTAQG